MRGARCAVLVARCSLHGARRGGQRSEPCYLLPPSIPINRYPGQEHPPKHNSRLVGNEEYTYPGTVPMVNGSTTCTHFIQTGCKPNKRGVMGYRRVHRVHSNMFQQHKLVHLVYCKTTRNLLCTFFRFRDSTSADFFPAEAHASQSTCKPARISSR